MTDAEEDERRGPRLPLTIEEPTQVPRLGLLLGYGAMLPFVAGALACWVFDGYHAALAAQLTVIWGAALLLFFSGVRRGLSFRTPGGPRPAQLVMFGWLFCLGLVVLLMPSVGLSLALMLAGFGSLWILDPKAAARREVPPYFARLRSVQMLIPIASIVAILLREGTL